jgi:cytochrome c556
MRSPYHSIPALLALALISSNAGAGEPTFQSVMQELGRDLHRISDAILQEDYPAIAAAAEAIAEHPHPSAAERRRVGAQLGPDMPRFQQAGEAVHQTAHELHEAAQRRDMEAVLRRYQPLMEGCVACHAQFRERARPPGGERPSDR